MAPPFQQRFLALARQRSALCVGVDPSAESLREWGLADDPPGLRAFCQRMVETCAPLVAAVKPQAAFFERHGPAGLEVLRSTIAAIHEHGALAIVDAKRGDIASTAAAYGDAFLGPDSAFGGDALTLTAYLGFAALTPILDSARRAAGGVFVVVRSSNPEGSGLQRAVMPDGRSVAEHLADEIAAGNAATGAEGAGFIGAVVGATMGREARSLAERMPNALLLVPGIGAQGATIADVRQDFAAHYRRVIPSISRGISRAGPDAAGLRRQTERYIGEIRGAEG